MGRRMEEAPCVDLRPKPFLSVVFHFLAMSIDIKCNSCSAKYSVSDRLAGGSVKCSKCQAPIHVPIVPRQPSPTPALSAADAAADAADLSFDYAPNLAVASAGVQTMVAPAASEVAPQPAAADEPIPETTPAVAAERSKRFPFTWPKLSFRRSGGALCVAGQPGDFQLRRYWTARLAPSLWGLSLVAGLSLAYLAVRQLLALGGLPAELQPTSLWGGVAQIAGVVVGLIVVRISLETVGLLFEIAKTLREVRDELRKGD